VEVLWGPMESAGMRVDDREGGGTTPTLQLINTETMKGKEEHPHKPSPPPFSSGGSHGMCTPNFS
jgi:hypothetical protein